MMIKYLFPLGIFLSVACTSVVFPMKQHRVVVLDTGLDLNDPRFKGVLCKDGHKDFTGEGITDTNGHGTHIAGLIKQYAKNKNYCMVILKYWADDKRENSKNIRDYANALSYIAQMYPPPTIVNYSGNGEYPLNEEKMIFKTMKDTTWVVAAGNDKLDLKYHESFPGSLGYHNVQVVGSLTKDRMQRSSFSNYNLYGMLWEVGENVKSTLPNGSEGFMSGTSQSTAIRTGKLINTLD